MNKEQKKGLFSKACKAYRTYQDYVSDRILRCDEEWYRPWHKLNFHEQNGWVEVVKMLDRMMSKRDVVQVKNPRTGRYMKIDRSAGEIVSIKKSEGPYKNIPIATLAYKPPAPQEQENVT